MASNDSPRDQQAHEEFENILKQENNIAYKWYQKNKFEHAAVKSLFNNFVKNNQEAQFKDLLSSMFTLPKGGKFEDDEEAGGSAF